MKIPKEFNSPVESETLEEMRRKLRRRALGVGVERFFCSLLILAGGMCLIITDHVYAALPYLVGCVMIVLGGNDIIRGFCRREFLTKETRQIANGTVNLLLGAVILINRADADNVIGSIWGFLGLVKGADMLNTAIYQCARHKPFVLKSVHSVVEIVLGILLLAYPYHAVRHHVFILGLELVLLGANRLRESRDPAKNEAKTEQEKMEVISE